MFRLFQVFEILCGSFDYWISKLFPIRDHWFWMNDSFEIFIEFSLLDINKLFKFWDGFFWIPWNCIDIFKILERFPSDFYHLVTLFFFLLVCLVLFCFQNYYCCGRSSRTGILWSELFKFFKSSVDISMKIQRQNPIT